uniref:Ig-like domain-containing protein n=1 Tax=Naja naja TaxID=35670 RepID=A0A8C6VCC2_NAJNA
GRWALDSKLTAILLAAHFLMQAKTECRFLNGTQRVRFLFRYIYDRQEFVCFNSDLGKNVAITALGEGDADKWNRDEQILHYQKAQVDRLCRRNYLLGSYEAAKREERLIASPTTILLCTATGFYPLEIEIQWLKNGKLEEEGVAFGEELQNGDWTYQLQVMLETQPQRGDVYTCQVGHASLEAPITIQWEPRSSSSARSKLWTGIMGAMIGVAFLAVGLFSYLKSKKGESGGAGGEIVWRGPYRGGLSSSSAGGQEGPLRNSFGNFCSWRGY